MEYHLNYLQLNGLSFTDSPALVKLPDSDWTAHLRTDSAPPLSKLTYQGIIKFYMDKHLYKNEIETVTNGYIRSPISLDALYEDFQKMNQPYHKLEVDTTLQYSINAIHEAFRPSKKLHIVHYADVRLYPWPLNTSAELPFTQDQRVNDYLDSLFERREILDRKKNFHNLYNYIFDACRFPIHKIKDGLCFTGNLEKDYIFPITAHIRPGLASVNRLAKLKNRLVCGVPKLELLPECMFAYPLFNDYLKTGLSPLLWGYETMLGGWLKLRQEMEPSLLSRFFVLSTDWSQFDHRVLFELMNIILENDKDYYDWTEYQPTADYPFSKLDPTRLKNLYNWLTYASFSSPILMPDGKLWFRVRNGLPSGMFRTQYLDSKINGIMLLCILIDAGFIIDVEKFMKLLGDDGLTAIQQFLPPSAVPGFLKFLSQRALIRFNAVLSADATEIHQSFDFCELLGYRNFAGKPYRDELKLIAQMLYPESGSFELNALMGRCIGIAYASLGRHERLLRLCRDIYEYLRTNGVQPKQAAFYRLFDPNLRVDPTFVPDHFPTVHEIQKWTSCPYVRQKSDNERYWPTSHFLEIEDIDSRLSALLTSAFT